MVVPDANNGIDDRMVSPAIERSRVFWDDWVLIEGSSLAVHGDTLSE